MIEQEWLACTNPAQMLAFLGRRASERKLRLLNCGFWRRLWCFVEADLRAVVEKAVALAEQHADGLINKEVCTAFHNDVYDAWHAEYQAGMNRIGFGVAMNLLVGHFLPDETQYEDFCPASAEYESWRCACWYGEMTDPVYAAARTADRATDPRDPDFDRNNSCATRDAELATHCYLLRDIFGNPFRPIAIDRRWLRWHDCATVNIAQCIYDSDRFQDLPILGDALEEAGCTNPDILGHCRGPNEHVRGCWVVDSVLGKR